MSYKAIVEIGISSPNSRFSPGTLLLTNLGGQMPVWIKEDDSKASVFPVNPGIKKPGMELGAIGVATFDLRLNKLTQKMDYMVVAFSEFKTVLDEAQTTDYFVQKHGTVNIGYTPSDPGEVVEKETPATVTNENPLP
jgi:hypothetical protein